MIMAAPSRTVMNKALAAVVREGLHLLDQTASLIQSSRHTRKGWIRPTALLPTKPILNDIDSGVQDPGAFHSGESAMDTSIAAYAAAGQQQQQQQQQQHDATSDPRVRSQRHRILSTARTCLEEMASIHPHRIFHASMSNSGSKSTLSTSIPLFVHGEPLVFLDCFVHPSLQYAKIYWMLPYSIMLEEVDSTPSTSQWHTLQEQQEGLLAVGQPMLGAKSSQGRKNDGQQSHPALQTFRSKLVAALGYRHKARPPKILLVPATKQMIMTALDEILQ